MRNERFEATGVKSGDTTHLGGGRVRVLGRRSDVLKNSLNLSRGHLE